MYDHKYQKCPHKEFFEAVKSDQDKFSLKCSPINVLLKVTLKNQTVSGNFCYCVNNTSKKAKHLQQGRQNFGSKEENRSPTFLA